LNGHALRFLWKLAPIGLRAAVRWLSTLESPKYPRARTVRWNAPTAPQRVRPPDAAGAETTCPTRSPTATLCCGIARVATSRPATSTFPNPGRTRGEQIFWLRYEAWWKWLQLRWVEPRAEQDHPGRPAGVVGLHQEPPAPVEHEVEHQQDRAHPEHPPGDEPTGSGGRRVARRRGQSHDRQDDADQRGSPAQAQTDDVGHERADHHPRVRGLLVLAITPTGWRRRWWVPAPGWRRVPTTLSRGRRVAAPWRRHIASGPTSSRGWRGERTLSITHECPSTGDGSHSME